MKLIQTNHKKSPLRTDFIIGETKTWPPNLSEPFILISDPIDKSKDCRFIKTTPVRAIISSPFLGKSKKDVFRIRTDNSTYELKVIE